MAIVLFIALYGCKQRNQHSKMKTFSSNSIDQLNNYVSQFRKNNPVPGIAIVVIHQDSVYDQTIGFSDTLSSTIPFSTGSISEPMLATGIMKLIDSGKLNLDDPVIRYLPYFKLGNQENQTITIRHLLSHTSGIPHFQVAWDMPNNSATALEVTTKSIAGQQPKFPVSGSRVSRSPYNYDILADLISKATGQPFEKYMENAVFNPLGMQHSSFSKPLHVVQPQHIKNWLSYAVAADSIYPYNRENGGSNGLHTTAKDMATWMYMLLNGGATAHKPFVKPALFEDFFAPQYKTGPASFIGFGWEIRSDEGTDTYFKNNKLSNFSSYIALIPSRHIGIAIFSNITGDFDPEAPARQLLSWLSGNQLPQPRIPVNIAMSQAFYKTGSLDTAFALYKRLKRAHAAQYDLSEKALNNFGANLIGHLRDKASAIAAFKFCAAQYPSSPFAYLNLAEIYMHNKQIPEALSALDQSKPFLKNSAAKDQARYIAQYLEDLSKDPDPG